ncbi:MAG: cyclic nucleotide-binding domain-containing protein [Methyloligellaceae bacterium]
MKLDNIVELLGCVPLFNGLNDEQLARLAFEGEKVLIHSERPIISKDQAGDAAYLIVDGTALRISGPGIKGQPEILKTGTFIGEMAMLIATHYGSTIIAYGEVKALRFSYMQMQNIMQSDVSLAQHFAEHVRTRFTTFTSQLKQLETEMFNDDEGEMAIPSESTIASMASTFVNSGQNLQ